ncbi:hypothetical protein BHE90_004029 [Fusarium euwallaceae]|uniref:Uncharacterized protein n=2 Tax=Fusarium solani species complex TaxID=232080 RepID=A0A3M2S135_9HYPO|nr:hypothetical protein CDV36_009109 [Fusarium kuroshium]RTE81493.1 hypothetical protein BHE90_004029 [Fusarium euwallaceae]
MLTPRKQIPSTVTMAVFTIKALASALAIFGAFATGAVADELPELPEAALTAQTTTYQPVTQQHGVATADGNVVYSLSVCTIVQHTDCSLVLSTDSQIPPPIATDDFSVPGEGEPTSVNGMGETSPGEDYPKVSETGPHASVPTGSKPDYSALPPPEGAPSQPGVPVPSPSAGEPVPTMPSGAPGEPIPIPSVIDTTDEPGNPTAVTTDYDGPSVTAGGSASGSASGADSASDTDTDFPTVTLPVSSDGPSATGGDGDNTAITGTPTVTASGAVVMAPAARAVALGFVVMLVAAAF